MKLLLLVFLLSGCGKFQRAWTSYTGGLTEKCSSVGTVYVQSDSGLAPLLGRDGLPVPCKP